MLLCTAQKYVQMPFLRSNTARQHQADHLMTTNSTGCHATFVLWAHCGMVLFIH
jgi:hypothetical protein